MKQKNKFYLYLLLFLAIITTGFSFNFKAVYLKPSIGGQISSNELKKYPEILIVNSFKELKNSVNKKIAIWIDKDALNIMDDTIIDNNWLSKKPQNLYPIVLIGYNNALYSFREKLSGFRIEGPYVDWSKIKLEPGFSIWMIKKKTKTSVSALMKGYKEIPKAKRILTITNALLENKFPIDVNIKDKFPK
jgi:hypothetical protein